jgi:RNA polymerase sigma-70 factor (ECF subfamily)
MDDMADNFETATVLPSIPPASNPSDIELVARVNAADETAFEELFNRHKRRVALIAGRFFRQREQVEEIVQESFTKAYFGLSEFGNQQENSFASWIARIAFNSCYDELRRMKRRPESSLSDISEEDSAWLSKQLHSNTTAGNIESAAITHDLAEKLLSRLSPEDRLVLVMLDMEGMSVSDIAKTNKWSMSKVKVRAHRARARLRRVLDRFL